MAECREENAGAVPIPSPEHSQALGDLISIFLTLKSEGAASARASGGGRDPAEVPGSSGQLGQDSMYGTAG